MPAAPRSSRAAPSRHLHRLANTAALLGWAGALLLGAMGEFACADEPGPPPPARSAAALALVERAIGCAGGERYAAVAQTVWQVEGTSGGAQPMPFTGEIAQAYPDKLRIRFEMKVGPDRTFQYASTFDGRAGWVVLNGEKRAMSADEVAEALETANLSNASHLLALRSDAAFGLADPVDVERDGSTLRSVTVSRTGRRSLALLFDPESGRLARSEAQVKDLRAGGELVAQATVLKDFRDHEGVTHPMAWTVFRNGKEHSTTRVRELVSAATVDAALFVEPLSK